MNIPMSMLVPGDRINKPCGRSWSAHCVAQYASKLRFYDHIHFLSSGCPRLETHDVDHKSPDTVRFIRKMPSGDPKDVFVSRDSGEVLSKDMSEADRRFMDPATRSSKFLYITDSFVIPTHRAGGEDAGVPTIADVCVIINIHVPLGVLPHVEALFVRVCSVDDVVADHRIWKLELYGCLRVNAGSNTR